MDTKNIHIEVDEDQFEALEAKKDREGLTWKGVLLHGWDIEEDYSSAFSEGDRVETDGGSGEVFGVDDHGDVLVMFDDDVDRYRGTDEIPLPRAIDPKKLELVDEEDDE